MSGQNSSAAEEWDLVYCIVPLAAVNSNIPYIINAIALTGSAARSETDAPFKKRAFDPRENLLSLLSAPESALDERKKVLVRDALERNTSAPIDNVKMHARRLARQLVS